MATDGNEDPRPARGKGVDLVDFSEVLKAEHRAIACRREKWLKAEDLEAYGIKNEVRTVKGGQSAIGDSFPVSDTVGLALSGGGMRSAAFCLGAIQALEVCGVFKRIDYLSTVSGGGYIGTSLTAVLDAQRKNPAFGASFPFASRLGGGETPSLQHIRDYSNFLKPHGSWDILLSAGIYLRGIAANVLLVLPWILVIAAITVLWKPTVEDVKASRFMCCDLTWLTDASFFNYTRIALTIFALFLLSWAVTRSIPKYLNEPDVPNWRSKWFARALILIAIVVVLDMQAFVLQEMFAYSARQAGDGGGWMEWIVAAAKYIAVVLAPLAAVIGFFNDKLGFLIKRATETSDFRTRLVAFLSRALIYATACILPLLLWMVYLMLSYWGIRNEGEFAAPGWIVSASGMWPFSLDARAPVSLVYFAFGFTLLAISFLLEPNSNSLHRLYRDRLGKAFLFEPVPVLTQGPSQTIKPLNSIKISSLHEEAGPYHIINAALNIQGSKTANRRGRDADFFMFSNYYVGSRATKYVLTELLEEKEPYLDLATVMAVSGAAASSNMGASDLKPWSLTLAMLNVRLGFWMRNPKHVEAPAREALNEWTDFYFLKEMLGRLDENSWNVYLTDGGHVENLGIYELLKRRCQLIIAVDAEADPDLNFPSLIALQRYARIDLGIRIDLPWYAIRRASLEANAKLNKMGDAGQIVDHFGPHCAIGIIRYSGDQFGYLLYVKSSVTGDENDYVMDYKRRNATFPHQTTGDLFYSEEQFEAYRNLGFHALQRVFEGPDTVVEANAGEPTPTPAGAAATGTGRGGGRSKRPTNPLLGKVCAILNVKPPKRPAASKAKRVESTDEDAVKGRPDYAVPPDEKPS